MKHWASLGALLGLGLLLGMAARELVRAVHERPRPLAAPVIEAWSVYETAAGVATAIQVRPRRDSRDSLVAQVTALSVEGWVTTNPVPSKMVKLVVEQPAPEAGGRYTVVFQICVQRDGARRCAGDSTVIPLRGRRGGVVL